MQVTFIEASILDPVRRNVLQLGSYASVIEFLQDRHPAGFNVPTDISVNGEVLEVKDYDRALEDGDVVLVVERPGDPITAAIAWYSAQTVMVQLAITMAFTLVTSKIFAPKMPSMGGGSQAGSRSSVYSLSSNQNTARLGAVIPVIYGKVRSWPDMVEQPYYRYNNNEQYLYMTMLVARGTMAIDDLLVADTRLKDLPPGTLTYGTFKPDATPVPQTLITATEPNYRQRVRTVPEVSNMEIRGNPDIGKVPVSIAGNLITVKPQADGYELDVAGLPIGAEVIINGVRYHVTATDATAKTITTDVAPPSTPAAWTSPADTATDTYEVTLASNVISILHRHHGPGGATPPGGAHIPFPPANFPADALMSANGTVFKVDHINSQGELVIKDAYGPTSWTVNGALSFVTFEEVELDYDITYGPYVLNKDGEPTAEKIEFDLTFPGGIYDTDSGSGKLIGRSVSINFTVNALDAAGVVLGTQTTPFTYTGRETSPKRFTESLALPVAGAARYTVIVKRTTDEPITLNAGDRPYLERLKYVEPAPNCADWGDVTCLWVKAKATNGLSQNSQFSVNVWTRRTDVGNTVTDVLGDIYTNTVYGAKLPATDLIFEGGGTESVNGAFVDKMTIMDAMRQATDAHRYHVYPYGAAIIAKKSEPQALRSYLFNETNILADTLTVSYAFGEQKDHDGFRVSYRNNTDFGLAEYTYPVGAVSPKTVELWGITSQADAEGYCRYIWKADSTRRKSISFETDIQGILPHLLDRIGVSHSMTRWGTSGLVKAVSGTSIQADFSGLPDLTGSLVVIFMDDKGKPSQEIPAVKVDDFHFTAAAPTWVAAGTRFSIGQQAAVVHDYVVTNISPSSDSVVKITANNYDPAIYT